MMLIFLIVGVIAFILAFLFYPVDDLIDLIHPPGQFCATPTAMMVTGFHTFLLASIIAFTIAHGVLDKPLGSGIDMFAAVFGGVPLLLAALAFLDRIEHRLRGDKGDGDKKRCYMYVR
jgi:hypothetical protein